VLWTDGQRALAHALEAAWEEAVERHHFKLLCAYAMQGFDGSEQTVDFEKVCSNHSSVQPGRHVAALHQHSRTLAEEAARRAAVEARIQTLSEASRRFNEAPLEPRAVLDVVAREVSSRMQAFCSVALVSADGRTLMVASRHATATRVEEKPVWWDGESVMAEVVRTGQPLLRSAHGDVCAVPLWNRDKLIGVLLVAQPPSGKRLAAEDLSLVRDLGDRASMAILHAQQYDELSQERARLDLLAHASEVLASSLSYEDTLKNVVGLVLPLLGDFGFFDVVVGPDEVRRISKAHEDPRRQAILEKTSWVRSTHTELNLCALSSGQPAIHSDIDDAWCQQIATSPEHLQLLRELDFQSMITVPLRFQGRVLGALTLFHAGYGRRYGSADLKLAEELARRAAAAVENARLYQEAHQAIAVRDDFLSMAGHELRTPLTSLQLQLYNVVKLARQASPTEKILVRAEKAMQNLNRFNHLVAELLDVSRIRAGRLNLELGEFDLGDCVRELLQRQRDELSKAGCSVQVRLEPGLVGQWDRLRIEQVLTNLLSNAMKYGARKPIEIEARRESGKTVLSVKDHGIGLSREDQSRVFQRFERAVSSQNFGGLGLGLWIVRQLVEAHGGTIRVESEPQRGACFEVQLPTLNSAPRRAEPSAPRG